MVLFERAVIVGVGLLGGSLGLALRQRNLAQEVIGVGRRPEALATAERLGAINRAAPRLSSACHGADLVVICTPVQSVVELVRECVPSVSPQALVTDVGSTKGTICEALSNAEHAHFCGSHPLAGSDKSGVEFADAQLFTDRLTVLTPVSATPPELVERTVALWHAVGSRTLSMSPGEHDHAVASTSHLPHLVAAALAAETSDQVLPLAATGWLDTTRIAGGSVELWQQIFLENRRPLLDALRNFSTSLEDWIGALEAADAQRIGKLLERGKQKRDSVGN